MKKSILIALVAGFIGFVAGNAFWYLASPLWINQVVADSNTANEDSLILSTGSFRDNGSKKGKGDVVIFENDGGNRTLRFSDFEVSNGPDLEVWLVESSDVQDAADVTSKPYVSLGQLKGNIGDQNYTIPADVDLEKYSSVVIWCEQFGVLFNPAALANP